MGGPRVHSGARPSGNLIKINTVINNLHNENYAKNVDIKKIEIINQSSAPFAASRKPIMEIISYRHNNDRALPSGPAQPLDFFQIV